MIKRIIVGVDGSEGAALALRWAVGLAKDEGAEIIAVYALGPVEDVTRGASNAVFVGLGMGRSKQSAWRDELRRELEEDWCAPLRTAGVPIRAHLEKASAAAGLMAVADREDADL